jgi:hypothetical protein
MIVLSNMAFSAENLSLNVSASGQWLTWVSAGRGHVKKPPGAAESKTESKGWQN